MNHRALTILAATIATLGFGAALAPRALAHPGHGLDTSGVGLLHFLLQPGHGGGIVIVVAVALGVVVLSNKRHRHG